MNQQGFVSAGGIEQWISVRGTSADNPALMSPDEKQELLTILDAGRDVFLGALDNMTDELAGRNPGAGRWSVLQCVEHVAVAEEYLLSQIARANRVDAPVINAVREAAIKKRGADRTRPVESPDVGKPTGRFRSLTDGVHHFLASRKRAIEFVEGCNEDLRAMLTDHPLIGPVNCYEMLLMMAVHPQRHAKQIDEIKQTFP